MPLSRYETLLQERADLIAEGKKSLETASEDKRSPSEDETKRHSEIKQRVGEIDAELTILEEQREMERNAPSTPIPSSDQTPTPTPAVTVHNRADDDPNRGFRTPRQFISAVLAHGRFGQMDERLKPLQTAGSDEQGTYADPYGGFAVPEGFSPNMLRLEPEDDFVSGRVTRIPMSNPSIKMPARVDKNHNSSVSGGLTVARSAETVSKSSSRFELEKVSLIANSLFGVAYATEEILTDSPISFAALIEVGFNDEFTSKLLDERINGTGVGEFEGILTSPALITVSAETGQPGTTIQFENVVKMRARAWRYNRCIWMANNDTIPQLMQMVQVVGTGGAPVWQPSAREDSPDLLLGRPLIFTEYVKTLGTSGDIILVNWSEYLEGLYQPLQSAESIHVRFLNHERTFKFWLRNDGRGWWRSDLTPKNSTVTLSPFVCLATRT